MSEIDRNTGYFYDLTLHKASKILFWESFEELIEGLDKCSCTS